MQKFRLRKELKKSYEPPKPLRKEEFIRNLNYPKARAFEVLKVQAGYIPKYVWAFAFAGRGGGIGEFSFRGIWHGRAGDGSKV